MKKMWSLWLRIANYFLGELGVYVILTCSLLLSPIMCMGAIILVTHCYDYDVYIEAMQLIANQRPKVFTTGPYKPLHDVAIIIYTNYDSQLHNELIVIDISH